MPEPPRRPDGGDDPGERRGNVSKVARLIDEYDLGDAGEELEARWLGEDGDRSSLRALADRFNQWLLEAATADADVSFLDGEVENLYRLLTDDDVSRGQRTRARRTLERWGVDPERLEADFVSHQAMHTYLTKHRGVERPSDGDDADRIERRSETIQRLRNRLTAVTERTIEDLRDAGHLAVDEYDVLVEVSVLCTGCGRYYDANELLAAGGCECGGQPSRP
ncbi:MAG: rod-determining factor RdfA [Halobacteriales archaeon]